MSKTKEQVEEAETQLQQEKLYVNYDTREYPLEVLVDKYNKNEFFIPAYQRAFVWEKDLAHMSRFIESVLLDLPIPYLFFADDPDTGKLEIVDGSQQIRTLVKFCANGFELKELDTLTLFNGFKFEDFSESRQRRFLRKTFKSIELTEKASSDIRRDLFARINTKSPMEVRRGLYNGKFIDFITSCANDDLFKKYCPISEERLKRRENEELVLRFFAYTEKYQTFVHSVENFLDVYTKEKHEKGFDEQALKQKFTDMLQFVEQNFSNGFRKKANDNTVPRGRFEAISVGIALAQATGLPLNKNISSWIDSEDFKEKTTSDAANNKSKLTGRIEFVRDKLLSNE